jgi:hypothetical protein
VEALALDAPPRTARSVRPKRKSSASPRTIANSAAEPFTTAALSASARDKERSSTGEQPGAPCDEGSSAAHVGAEASDADAHALTSDAATAAAWADASGLADAADGADPLLCSAASDPSVVLSQLRNVPYHAEACTELRACDELERALQHLDRIAVKETFRIGIVYVADGQTTEEEILSNVSGSAQYLRWLRSLGAHVQLADLPPEQYTGGLDRVSGNEGKLALLWQNDVAQVCFHVATMMPDLGGVEGGIMNRKRFVGNSYVMIVFSDDTLAQFDRRTIAGQFTLIHIVICPLADAKCDPPHGGFSVGCR